MSLNLDKSTWKRVAFCDVVRNVNDTVRDPESVSIDRIIAMEHMDPGELRIKRWGAVADGTTFTRRVTPGQTLFGKRRAYQRKVAYAEFDAICSGDIYTFEADETRMLGNFLPFLVQSNEFFDHALGTSAGSLSPRTNWRDLAKFEFYLPPLDEQKRIADLLWAIERHKGALKKRSENNAHTFHVFLRSEYGGSGGPAARIVDMCSSVVGGIWGLPEGESEVDVLALGPRVYLGGATWLSTCGSPVRSISARQAATRLIQKGDIILERSGGSPDQPVGRVVIAGERLDAAIPTDFQRLLRPARDVVEPQWLFWKLRLDWLDGVTRDFSRRTTNITNLSIPDYLKREVRVPPLADQRLLVSRIQTFERGQSAEIHEAEEATSLRAALLDDLFGGD